MNIQPPDWIGTTSAAWAAVSSCALSPADLADLMHYQEIDTWLSDYVRTENEMSASTTARGG